MNDERSTPATENVPIIQVKNLNVAYQLGHGQTVQAIEDINLEIFPGEFIIFFGPSGCGKSTLLYSISGLESHARGSITVNGHQVGTMKRDEAAKFLQREIGMIFQAFYLISSLSVVKNVLLPQMAVNASPRARERRARELLEHFGVLTQANKLPTDLSGGQQQRVAICRALVNNPSILLADEPVGNLDSKSAMDVIRLLLDLNVREKKTVILVTHDPSHLHFADRVFHMRDGKIINVQVNRAVKPTEEESPPSVPKDLQLLARSFAQLQSGQLGTLLIPLKAKEIVAEVLTDLSVEEMGRVEREVESTLIRSIADPDSLKTLLDDPARLGGLGLDRRTAEKLANRMNALVATIRQLQDLELSGHKPIPLEVVTLRTYLFDALSFEFIDPELIHRFDRILWDRLRNVIDGGEVIRRLHASLPAGLGFHQSVAEKISKRLELIILGKYQT